MSIDLSLDRIRRLVGLLPVYTRPTIHIAGTNGKGSVTAFLSSVLTTAGFNTGCFNSPHLVDVWDAITLNGKAVSKETYLASRKRVERVNNDYKLSSSNFEILSATAFLIFEDAQVEVAIIEVGMGGRLDATNVIADEQILVSAITSIDFDHQAFLGSTIEAIAREKAGILRKGKTCVLGTQTWPEVKNIIKEATEGLGGTLVIAPTVERRNWDESVDGHPPTLTDTFCLPPDPVQVTLPDHASPLKFLLPLHGDHQLANLSVSLAILSSLPPPISTRLSIPVITKGVAKTTWPGRLDFIRFGQFSIIADGAHNPASATALQTYLSSVPFLTGPRTFILGLSHSPPKTPLATLSPLLRPGDRAAVVGFTPVEDMPWVRAVSITELVKVARNLIGDAGEVEPAGELQAALDWAAEKSDIIIVAGSLYLVADLYRLIRNNMN